MMRLVKAEDSNVVALPKAWDGRGPCPTCHRRLRRGWHEFGGAVAKGAIALTATAWVAMLLLAMWEVWHAPGETRPFVVLTLGLGGWLVWRAVSWVWALAEGWRPWRQHAFVEHIDRGQEQRHGP